MGIIFLVSNKGVLIMGQNYKIYAVYHLEDEKDDVLTNSFVTASDIVKNKKAHLKGFHDEDTAIEWLRKARLNAIDCGNIILHPDFQDKLSQQPHGYYFHRPSDQFTFLELEAMVYKKNIVKLYHEI